MPERFREPLMKVAYKLLSRDEATFEELTPSEQKLWNSFETDQIYRLLTGEADTVPEFRFNRYTVDTTDGYCEQPQNLPAPSATSRTIVQPPALPPVQPPAITAKPPKASTSARARLPSSTTSSNTSSRPSTTRHHQGHPPRALFPEPDTRPALTPRRHLAHIVQPPIPLQADHRHLQHQRHLR